MAWTAPVTFVGNQVLTSTHLNTYIRDNMLEMAPAQASTEGSYFVADGANSVVERQITSKRVSTSQGTATLSFTDLATVGPSVTVTTGAKALVFIGAEMQNSSTGDAAMSWEVSGASTFAAVNTWNISVGGITAANPCQFGGVHMKTDLTPGSNTFTAKYRAGTTGTATFANRVIIVMPF